MHSIAKTVKIPFMKSGLRGNDKSNPTPFNKSLQDPRKRILSRGVEGEGEGEQPAESAPGTTTPEQPSEMKPQ
jgi:hypothetical protein